MIHSKQLELGVVKVLIYIAGKMSGLPDYNRPAFMQAEKMLKDKGHIVINPAYNPDGLTHEQYMHICLPMVEVADAIYLLDGWEDSRGAFREYLHAKDLNKVILGYWCE